MKSTYYAGRAQYTALLKAGIRIFEYEPAMIHAKSIVTDGRFVSAGTLNFDNRSMSFNAGGVTATGRFATQASRPQRSNDTRSSATIMEPLVCIG